MRAYRGATSPQHSAKNSASERSVSERSFRSSGSVVEAFPEPTTVAIVIVNYFKADRLLECVRSLARQSGAHKTTLAVVENSADADEHRRLATAAAEHDFVLVNPGANLGYTKGCNLGVQSLTHTDFVVLCNPDIIWDEPDTIDRLIDIAASDPSIGVLAPVQVSDDGALVETARKFPTLLHQIKRRLWPQHGSEIHLIDPLAEGRTDLIDVDWLQSSCALIRRSLWDQLGGLDQRYFLFMSDVELGRATWNAGLRVCLTSSVRVRADGKRASAGGFRALLTSRTQRSHLLDAIRYYLANGFRSGRRAELPGSSS
ncbi:glycosyltransferase family 2 protein [Bradyrhizobium sp. ORS 375]|uniref:glycosyltransferase n=1 Tax=Bradyrhizobium sp. (strain ORS 375) TaxID=566679 RepID=UPI001FCAA44D|nr:glycosyltransferase family 2 protein [Bradyrhizobium sp. ORS 375]